MVEGLNQVTCGVRSEEICKKEKKNLMKLHPDSAIATKNHVENPKSAANDNYQNKSLQLYVCQEQLFQSHS